MQAAVLGTAEMADTAAVADIAALMDTAEVVYLAVAVDTAAVVVGNTCRRIAYGAAPAGVERALTKRAG